MRQMSFYFDFTSPFSYLALQRLPAIATQFHYDVSYRAVDLKEIKRLAGNTGSATREIPIKLRYAKIDQKRWAARYGVPIATPALYDSSRLCRGSFFAEDRGQQRDYLTLAFRRIWGEGGNMLDENLLGDIAREMGWDAQTFLAYSLSLEADARYRTSTKEAHENGIFGVPTVMIGNEMWWGNDRFDFLEEFLGAAATTEKAD